MEEKEVPILLDDEELSPKYATDLAAGADVYAACPEPLIIAPNTSALVPTGLKFAIPEGFEIQVRPRSGLALKYLVTVLNTPGTIDSDYRGELKIILINHGSEPFIVTYGMRIAQIVLAEVTRARFVAEKELTSTVRGKGGFGHTGTH